MSCDAQRLYELLPAIYRIRDESKSHALKELLSVIAEQIGILEEDLAQLYDDQFIETCADWVVPYIGDLIGYRTLRSSIPNVASPRADVANTIAYRRRKGTATALEQMAQDVTNWPARVVEYFHVLATSQHMNHIRPKSQMTPNLRDWELFEYCNTPFDRTPHSVDIRLIDKRAGKYNIPNIGVHLWRIGSNRLAVSPVRRLNNDPDDGRFLFNPLGLDTVLFNRPEREVTIVHLAEPSNVPAPISRRVLHEHKDRYYGEGRSLVVYEAGKPIDAERIVVFDLSDEDAGAWRNIPLPPGFDTGAGDWVAVDPELGRLVFLKQPSGPVTVTYHYGFSTDIGGGEYDRASSFDATLQETGAPVKKVPSEFPTVGAALAALGSKNGVVEIDGSILLTGPLNITAAARQRIELRAADGCRPILELEGDSAIHGSEHAEVTVNGLLVAGRTLRVNGDRTMRVRLVHCTLVPDVQVERGRLKAAITPGFRVESEGTAVEVEHSIILGAVQAARDSRIQIRNSIIDAMDKTACAFGPVPSVSTPPPPAGRLSAISSTFIGRVHTELIELASNCIFLACSDDPAVPPVQADRLQEGCVRFSFVPDGSHVPRQYRCQPALALEQRATELGKKTSDLSPDERRLAAGLVQPTFTSVHYGDYGYCQLSRLCPKEISQGADDESEMGVFHDLYQPQRETNLRVRLQEYLRFGLAAGVFYET
ncbi:MAG: hypothetical protein ABIK86_01695 [candidate division WOR-3 bacterium]